MNTVKLINWIKKQNPIFVVLFGVGTLIFIGIFDYMLVGKHLTWCAGIRKEDVIMFYFSRSLFEWITFGIGILLGVKITEDYRNVDVPGM